MTAAPLRLTHSSICKWESLCSLVQYGPRFGVQAQFHCLANRAGQGSLVQSQSLVDARVFHCPLQVIIPAPVTCPRNAPALPDLSRRPVFPDRALARIDERPLTVFHAHKNMNAFLQSIPRK